MVHRSERNLVMDHNRVTVQSPERVEEKVFLAGEQWDSEVEATVPSAQNKLARLAYVSYVALGYRELRGSGALVLEVGVADLLGWSVLGR